MSDDFYSMAEAGQYMMAKIPNAKDSLADYEKYYNDISAAYAAGQIS